MLISHKGHTDSIQVYSVTVMTHVKALQAGHSSQGTSEPITPAYTQTEIIDNLKLSKTNIKMMHIDNYIPEIWKKNQKK